jgi:hypothetical protein
LQETLNDESRTGDRLTAIVESSLADAESALGEATFGDQVARVAGGMSGGQFERRASAALDRTVHVPLPPHAGVFAGEEEPPARARQPRAQARIE